jgi:hypothetical protein
VTDAPETLSPVRLADYIRQALNDVTDFAAFWYHVAGDRHDYGEALAAALASEPVVVLHVRDVRFDNPNALLDDLVALIESNRATCEHAVAPDATRCAVVLLARTELSLPHVSSPVQLPEWFPIAGGSVVTTRIVDVTWLATAPLNCPEACIPDLSSALYRVERALVERLALTHDCDKASTNSLFDQVRNNESESFVAILASARAAIESVANPQGYRPSLRGDGFVARLWRSAQTQNPDALGRVAKALAAALQLPAKATWPHETLAAVLRRPTNRIEDPRRRFTFSLIAAIAAAAQLTTAAAHADDYPALPVALIRTTSYDLRRALDEAEALILDLSHPRYP